MDPVNSSAPSGEDASSSATQASPPYRLRSRGLQVQQTPGQSASDFYQQLVAQTTTAQGGDPQGPTGTSERVLPLRPRDQAAEGDSGAAGEGDSEAHPTTPSEDAAPATAAAPMPADHANDVPQIVITPAASPLGAPPVSRRRRVGGLRPMTKRRSRALLEERGREGGGEEEDEMEGDGRGDVDAHGAIDGVERGGHFLRTRP